MPTGTHRGSYFPIHHKKRHLHGYTDPEASDMGVPPSRGSNVYAMCLKIGLVLVLLVTSFFLGLSVGARRREHEESSNTFMPPSKLPGETTNRKNANTSLVPFVGRPTYFSENKTWSTPGAISDALWLEERETMAKDRFVKIDNPEKYGVPQGTRDKKGVQFYSIGAYHQLHCLVCQVPLEANTMQDVS